VIFPRSDAHPSDLEDQEAQSYFPILSLPSQLGSPRTTRSPTPCDSVPSRTELTPQHPGRRTNSRGEFFPESSLTGNPTAQIRSSGRLRLPAMTGAPPGRRSQGGCRILTGVGRFKVDDLHWFRTVWFSVRLRIVFVNLISLQFNSIQSWFVVFVLYMYVVNLNFSSSILFRICYQNQRHIHLLFCKVVLILVASTSHSPLPLHSTEPFFFTSCGVSFSKGCLHQVPRGKSKATSNLSNILAKFYLQHVTCHEFRKQRLSCRN